MLRQAGLGLLAGVAFGASARWWMSWVTTQPSFTWSGTGFILAVMGFMGLLLGLVHAARTQNRSRWWRVLALPALLPFAGPGMLFLPAIVMGGPALARRGPIWWRCVGLAVVLIVMPGVVWLGGGDAEQALLSPVLVCGGFAVLSLLLAGGWSTVFRPWDSTGTNPRQGFSRPTSQRVTSSSSAG